MVWPAVLLLVNFLCLKLVPNVVAGVASEEDSSDEKGDIPLWLIWLHEKHEDSHDGTSQSAECNADVEQSD